MKAAGADAIFVAMSAVVNARHRLVAKHGFDLMMAAAWITEDTQVRAGCSGGVISLAFVRDRLNAQVRSCVWP
mgnify:CR=1 FL=1